jgi:hypothetical protein
MGSIRRITTAVALAVAVLHGAAVVAAAAAFAGEALSATADCCVAGAHPGAQCPLHRKTQSSECRISCASSTAGPIVLASGALLLPPIVIAEGLPARAPFVALLTQVLDVPAFSDTPPPRSSVLT